jgi:hypothetical protein
MRRPQDISTPIFGGLVVALVKTLWKGGKK